MPPTPNDKPVNNIKVDKPARPPIGPPSAAKPGGVLVGAKPEEKTDQDPNLLIPPEETIWAKYSSNGESLLSGLASFLLHMALLLLVLVGIRFLFSSGGDVDAEELEPVLIGDGFEGGGGGHEQGVGTDLGNKSSNNDQVKDLNEPMKPIKDDPIEEPKVKQDTNPTIKDDPFADEVIKKITKKPELKPIGPQLKDALEGLAGFGKGGTGSGGGEGGGHGKGRGTGVGDGTGKSNARGKRNQRWDLFFGDLDPETYLARTKAMDMILVVPDQKAKLMAINDFRNPVLESVDIKALNRNWFTDDKLESRDGVSRFLKLDFVPSALLFFYPYELEKELLKKEMDFAKIRGRTKEDDITYTKFRIGFSGGKHVINVVDQRGK